MKVLLLSTYDIGQGAGRAAYRLYQGLRQAGIEAQLLVNKKSADDPSVLSPTTPLEMAIAQTRARIDQFPLKFYSQREETYFSPQWLPDRLAKKIRDLNPDVINVHWTQAGFMQIESLAQFHKPIVWTLHDQWALTGGCHYTNGCDRYQRGCGQCPQLGSQTQKDLSHWIWQRKAKAWKNLDLTVVALSHWLADCVQKSPLLQNYPLKIIPNGLDPKQYHPIDQAIAKDLLGLPSDKIIILFGAMQATSDRRKGFSLLQEALTKLSQTEWPDKLQILIFGASEPEHAPDFGLSTQYLGQLHDHLSLRLVYSAADVFLAPSLEDNLPNTVLEALTCGTPCVAFNIGGMPDLIQHQKNGYLAEPFNVDDFVAGIIYFCIHCQKRLTSKTLSNYQIEATFRQEQQAKAYKNIFQSL